MRFGSIVNGNICSASNGPVGHRTDITSHRYVSSYF
jgi:hypothetical protein